MRKPTMPKMPLKPSKPTEKFIYSTGMISLYELFVSHSDNGWVNVEELYTTLKNLKSPKLTYDNLNVDPVDAEPVLVYYDSKKRDEEAFERDTKEYNEKLAIFDEKVKTYRKKMKEYNKQMVEYNDYIIENEVNKILENAKKKGVEITKEEAEKVVILQKLSE